MIYLKAPLPGDFYSATFDLLRFYCPFRCDLKSVRVNQRKIVKASRELVIIDNFSKLLLESSQKPVSWASRRILVYQVYSQLPLRRTPLGPAVSVRLREMSVL